MPLVLSSYAARARRDCRWAPSLFCLVQSSSPLQRTNLANLYYRMKNFTQYGNMKRRDGKSQREEKSRREKIKEEKSQKKEDEGAQKGRKVAKHCVFPMICGSGGSKSRLTKAAGAEPSGQIF